MKKVTWLILLLFVAFISNAQTDLSSEGNNSTSWEFYEVSIENQNGDFDANMDKVNYLKKIINEVYIFKEEVVPGDPRQRTIIRKPTIYNAVNRIEKFLRKEVKEKNIGNEEANSKMEFVLSVALAAVYSDETDSFEKHLHKNRKSVDKQLDLFNKVVLID